MPLDVAKLQAMLEELLRSERGREQLKLLLAAAATVTSADVKRLRKRIDATQEGFAVTYGLSVGSVRNWEQGARLPAGPGAMYLHCIAEDPKGMAGIAGRVLEGLLREIPDAQGQAP